QLSLMHNHRIGRNGAWVLAQASTVDPLGPPGVAEHMAGVLGGRGIGDPRVEMTLVDRQGADRRIGFPRPAAVDPGAVDAVVDAELHIPRVANATIARRTAGDTQRNAASVRRIVLAQDVADYRAQIVGEVDPEGDREIPDAKVKVVVIGNADE